MKNNAFYEAAIKVANMSRSLNWTESLKEVFDWNLLDLSERVELLYGLEGCTPFDCIEEWEELLAEAEADLEAYEEAEAEEAASWEAYNRAEQVELERYHGIW